MWRRDFRPTDKALALFQVYSLFPALLAFDGYTWRKESESSLNLSAYLLNGDPNNSTLSIRHQGLLAIRPPIFRVEAQMEGCSDPGQAEDWIAQGTVAWLRQLGFIEIEGVLRYSLFTACSELDRVRYPSVFEALKELPIVPHSNGEWSTLAHIFSFERVYISPGSTWEGFQDGFPMLKLPGQYERMYRLLPPEIEVVILS